MNPLTLVKRIQNINQKEATLGISEEASWHAKYKDSAYVYVGGLPFDLSEGDLLAVFAQYGEIVDVNLVRDKGTGKSKGFAFLAYEDQRSTNLAVDNLNGAQILGRTVRVDHVTKYKKLEEEDEETRQQKREERGVCRAFQKGECKYGDSCKFSHDEQRAANTGWGAEEDRHSKWDHNKFEGSGKGGRSAPWGEGYRSNKDSPRSRPKSDDTDREMSHKGIETNAKDFGRRCVDERRENETRQKNERHSLNIDKRPMSHKGIETNAKDFGRRYVDERRENEARQKNERHSLNIDKRPMSREEQNDMNDKRSKKYESESYSREEHNGMERDKRSVGDRDVTRYRHRRDEEEPRSRR